MGKGVKRQKGEWRKKRKQSFCKWGEELGKKLGYIMYRYKFSRMNTNKNSLKILETSSTF